MKDKILKSVGVLASIATIAGLYISIYGIPEFLKSRQTQLFSFNKDDFFDNPALIANDFQIGDTLKLVESITVKWSGVHNCGTSARSQQEYKAAHQRWKNSILTQLDSLTFVASDFQGGPATADQRRNPRTNVRSCDGSGTINSWVKFVKK